MLNFLTRFFSFFISNFYTACYWLIGRLFGLLNNTQNKMENTFNMMMTVNFQPLHDNVLIELFEEAQQTAGGIFLPDTAREKPQQATVVAVGAGKVDANGTLQPLAVKVADKVFISKWGGNDVKFGGKDYKLVKESDILGIVL
jgi:chaperonin GroES